MIKKKKKNTEHELERNKNGIDENRKRTKVRLEHGILNEIKFYTLII